MAFAAPAPKGAAERSGVQNVEQDPERIASGAQLWRDVLLLEPGCARFESSAVSIRPMLSTSRETGPLTRAEVLAAAGSDLGGVARQRRGGDIERFVGAQEVDVLMPAEALCRVFHRFGAAIAGGRSAIDDNADYIGLVDVGQGYQGRRGRQDQHQDAPNRRMG
ncbi:hypothetical protein AR540_23535 [Pseudomonas sp. EpS/L25]|nr:hypothetical protein AR540_23535 [Pseudomonas sp. EpS/L25]